MNNNLIKIRDLRERISKFKEILDWQNNFSCDDSQKQLEDVGVVIGIKNRVDYRIKNALNSIKNQDYPSRMVKILVVDYGSFAQKSQDIEKICRKYGAKYFKVENVGTWNRSHCLNIGIKMADTKYILVSDVDIIFEKNFISEAIKELQRDNRRAVFSTFFPSSKEDIDRETVISDEYFKKVKEKIIAYKDLNNIDYTYSKSINITLKRYYEFIQGYDENYCAWGAEDDDIIKRFEMMGLKITNIKEKSSCLHQWHLRYEGLTENEMAYIEKNKEYFRTVGGIIRNNKNWGIAKK